jgi:hypothetical protein
MLGAIMSMRGILLMSTWWIKECWEWKEGRRRGNLDGADALLDFAKDSHVCRVWYT